MRRSAKDAEAIAPAVCQLLVDGLRKAGARNPQLLVGTLKKGTLRDFLDVLTETVRALEGRPGVELKFKLGDRGARLKVPLTQAQVNELVVRNKREGPALATKFLQLDL